MTDLVFRNSAAAVGEAELQSLAALIGFDPPAALRRHYLRSNGGTPVLTAWELHSGEFLVVSEFLPVGPLEPGKRTIASTLEILQQRGVLKPGLVPFARDWGGNCVCFDAAGAVYFCSLDAWGAERSAAENIRHTTKLLAASFDDFLAGLQADPDDDS